MSEALPSRQVPALTKPLEILRERGRRNPIEFVESDGKHWLVRSFNEKMLQSFTSEVEGGRSFLEYVSLVTASFAELKEKYGIRVPMNLVAGEDEHGANTLFVFTAFVEHEEDPDDLSPEDKERRFAEQEHTLRQLLAYFKDKVASGGALLRDIAPLRQYQYGNLEGETENHLYLVDTDPYLATPDSRNRKSDTCGALLQLVDSVEELEKESGKDLSGFYEECREFYNETRKNYYLS